MESYDVLVLGSGPAGSKIAAGCARAGLAVALCDDPIGGTCSLRGCNPKKVLVAQAELVERVRRLQGRGLVAEAPGLHWPELVRFMREFTAPVSEATEKALTDRGVAVHHGHARFTAPREVAVGGRTLAATHVVIATGAEPVPLPFPGAELLATSTDVFDRDHLPERVVFVGAGYVSLELARVAAAAGAEVAVLEMAERILPAFDPDLTARLADLTRDLGIDLRTGATVVGVHAEEPGFRVEIEGDDIGKEAIATGLVVHGAGRRPALAGLDLERAGVAHEPAGVTVDDDRRSTSNPAVFAVGDAAASGLWPLTPAAEHDARIVIDQLTSGHSARPVSPALPSVAFTAPPIARVGLLESEARSRGLACDVRAGDMSRWNSVRKSGGAGGAYKILVDPGTDRILGAHLLGPGAEETINIFALAMQERVTASTLRTMPLAFPTHASDVGSML
jgi:glutathione reductase (NADPH)